MRISGGKHKNYRLLTEMKGIKLGDIKPTTDKVRQAVFNILNSSPLLEEDFIKNASVLDMFCGFGTLGIESLSRGAKFVTFVDLNHSHLELVKSNLKRMNAFESCSFIVSNATNFKGGGRKYNLVFLDPPYDEVNLIGESLNNLHQKDLIENNNIIIIEHDSRVKINSFGCFQRVSNREYGSSSITMMIYEKSFKAEPHFNLQTTY